MHIRKVSPISVEIIARFGRKICVRVRVLNLRNSETQHHRVNLRQLTSKLPGTPTRAELSVSEGRLNLNPSTTNASVGAIAPTEGSSL